MRFVNFLIAILILAIFSAAAFAASGGDYNLEISSAGGGSASSQDYSLSVSTGEGLQGEASGSGYILSAGSQYFFSTDSSPQFSNQSQSTSTPKEGETVELSTDFVDDSALDSVIISTNETGSFKNETIRISGIQNHTTYNWNKAASAGTTVAWKFFVFDSAGNYNETPLLFFFVGAVDKESPKILSLQSNPIQPSVGEQVTLEVEASDDFGLKSAVFEVNGQNSSEKIFSGTRGKVSHSFFAEGSTITWKAHVRDSSSKETSSEQKTLIVSTQVVQSSTSTTTVCSQAEKPKTIESLCINNVRKVYNVLCDVSTKKWFVETRDVPCTQNTTAKTSGELGDPTLGFAIIILLILIIAGVYFYKKNPEAFKKFFEKFAPQKTEESKPSKEEKK